MSKVLCAALLRNAKTQMCTHHRINVLHSTNALTHTHPLAIQFLCEKFCVRFPLRTHSGSLSPAARRTFGARIERAHCSSLCLPRVNSVFSAPSSHGRSKLVLSLSFFNLKQAKHSRGSKEQVILLSGAHQRRTDQSGPEILERLWNKEQTQWAPFLVGNLHLTSKCPFWRRKSQLKTELLF